MSLLTIIIVLVAVGVLLWAVNTYIPMDGKVKKVLNIVVIIIVVVWLLKAMGIWDHVEKVKVQADPPRMTA